MNKPKKFTVSILIILINTIKKTNPLKQALNPVIFITEIFAIFTALEAILNMGSNPTFSAYVSCALWSTVLISNFADSYSEYLGSKQLNIVKEMKFTLRALRITENGTYEKISIFELKKGDLCLVNKGELVPIDGVVQEGSALIDESLVNGRTDPVVKSCGSKPNYVYAGSRVISDQIIIKAETDNSLHEIQKNISTINNISKKKSQNDITLSLLLSSLSLLFVIVISTFQVLCKYHDINITISEQIAFIVCLIPTTIAGLIHSIKTANISRVLSMNIFASSSAAIESAGTVDLVYFDKTGTVTEIGMVASEITPSLNISEEEFLEKCYFCSLSDTSKENTSLINFLKEKFPNSIHAPPLNSKTVSYSAYTEMSGIDIDNKCYRKGSVERISSFCKEPISKDLSYCIQSIKEKGEIPILIASEEKIYGIIHYREVIKPQLAEELEKIKKMGIEPVLFSGDKTSATKHVANELSISNYIGELSGEEKLATIKEKQAQGYVVGVVGDGVNDTKALEEANFSLSMYSGCYQAQEVSGLIDLDSDPSKIAEIIKIGKQMFVTRGSITTFSIATDISKFFIMMPSIFANQLYFEHKYAMIQFSTPSNAILSLIIFNALMILILIPVSIRGVKLKASKSSANRNIIIYGLGGIITPILFIKIIDKILNLFLVVT